MIRYAAFWVLFSCIMIASANAYEFPPYEGLNLKIEGNVSENYTNNINFTNDERQEDFRTMLALGLDLRYEDRRRSMGFSGTANRRIEFNSDDVSNSSEKASLFLNNAFSEYDRIRISNTFTHTQEPDSFLNRSDIDACRNYYEDYGFSAEEIDAECNRFEEEFGRLRGRFDSYDNRLNFVYNKSVSEDVNINTNYSYAQYWSPEEDTTESQQNALGMGVNFSYSPAVIFSLSYKYRISDYENGDDISHQSISTGIKQYITKRIYFNGSVGRDFVSDRNDGISGNVSLTSEMDEQMTGSISYSRGVQISPNEDDTFRNWRLTGRLTMLLLEDLNGSLAAFYGQGDFVSADVTDTLTGASFSLSYNFWTGKRGSHFYGNLGYTYSDLDSTNEDRGYTRGLVNSSITLAF